MSMCVSEGRVYVCVGVGLCVWVGWWVAVWAALRSHLTVPVGSYHNNYCH